jgi:hypothetical protein
MNHVFFSKPLADARVARVVELLLEIGADAGGVSFFGLGVFPSFRT